MMERTLVFVDTSYLLASFYNSWEEGARQQLEISLATVVQTLNWHARHLVNQPVQRQFWYDGIPDSGPHRYQRTLRVIEGVQLRAGQLIEWGDRRTQKAVDTLLVADMVTAALRGQCTDMVLVTGDADMIPGVRAAVEEGIRVHLLGFGWDSIASSLRHTCDTATVLEPRVDFADSMQIRVLEGPRSPASTARPMVPGDEGDDAESDHPVSPAATEVRDGRPRATSVAADEAARTAADEEADAVEADAPEREVAAPADEPAPEIVDQPDVVTPPAEPAPVADAPTEPAGDPAPTEPAGDPAPTEPAADPAPVDPAPADPAPRPARPTPSVMAGRRKPLRSRYVPLSEEVWTSSGEVTPFDVGQQYARWWFEHAASDSQRDGAHLLSGGVLPPEVDRPLLQFACQVLGEFTLGEHQRVGLRDGFHEGIRAVLTTRR